MQVRTDPLALQGKGAQSKVVFPSAASSTDWTLGHGKAVLRAVDFYGDLRFA